MALPRKGDVQPVEGVAGGVPIPVTPTGNPDNKTAVNVETVEIVDHAQAYPGPDVDVPPGYQVVCCLRITQDTSEVGYFAGTAPNVLVAANRKEIVKGFALAFQVQNMNELFFGASVDGTIWELYAEAV